MTATASGADVLANTLLASLTAGESFDLPAVDIDGSLFQQPPETGELYDTIAKLTNAELTTKTVDGDGIFDVIMSSLSAHLKAEYNAGRITGQEYSKTYIALTQTAMQVAVQFLLARDAAYYQALLAQRQARAAESEMVTARVNLEIARAALVRGQYEANTAEANYGLIKMKIATEDASYAGIALDNAGKEFAQTNILPRQKDLLQEQIEVQRAQTQNTRTDTLAVDGLVGKQKELYSQQITSYQRDAETKVAKMFADAWITQKTMDEGLLAPTMFQNTKVDEVFTKLRSNVGLVP